MACLPGRSLNMIKQKRSSLAKAKLLQLTVLLLFCVFLAACNGNSEDIQQPADYGSYGQRFALSLARQYPLRSPGSSQEKKAADMITSALQEEGFSPEISQFYYKDEAGNVFSSRNISVLIPGTGFVRQDEAGNEIFFQRQVIIGAHYDSFYSEKDVADYKLEKEADETAEEPARSRSASAGIIPEPTLDMYDGIHDNASGIGALMTIARQIKEYEYGYDVYLVAFGAGKAGQAGARSLAGKMTPEQVKATDAMYCIDAIYAGDKVYAHAGRNSVRPFYRKSYEMRRKLYEVTDVFYENELYTKNGYMLYTNQANYDVELPEIATPVLFREWSFNESDYLPFDDLGIPIVYFESYDYDVQAYAEARESKNPAFTSSNGAIRNTHFDSTVYLNLLMNQRRAADTAQNAPRVDHLTRRINNTAFVILEAVDKGVHDALAYHEKASGSEDEAEAG